MRPNLFCCFFLIGCLTLPVSAQLREKLKERQGGKEVDTFTMLAKMYDKDGDQKISESEILQTCKERWSKLDQNQDNRVNEEELKKSSEYLKERKGENPIFNRFDKDGDGKVTAEELASLPPKLKQKVMENDINKDGTITFGESLNSSSSGLFQKMDKNKDEVLDLQEVKNEKLFQALDQDKNQSLTRDEFKSVVFSKFFTTYDKNQDREVTWEEYLNEHQARFQKSDLNKDKMLTKEEVQPRRNLESQPTTKEAQPTTKGKEMSESEVEEMLDELVGTESKDTESSEAESLLDGF